MYNAKKISLSVFKYLFLVYMCERFPAYMCVHSMYAAPVEVRSCQILWA